MAGREPGHVHFNEYQKLQLLHARTGIHGCDELHPRWQFHGSARPKQIQLTSLERLAEGLQNNSRELRQFIEKENAVVCERKLAGSEGHAARDSCRFREEPP